MDAQNHHDICKPRASSLEHIPYWRQALAIFCHLVLLFPLGPHHKQVIRASPSFTSHSLAAFRQRECLSCLCKPLYDYPLKAAVVDGRGKKIRWYSDLLRLRQSLLHLSKESDSTCFWQNSSRSDSSPVRSGLLDDLLSAGGLRVSAESGFRGSRWPWLPHTSSPAEPLPTLGFLLLSQGDTWLLYLEPLLYQEHSIFCLPRFFSPLNIPHISIPSPTSDMKPWFQYTWPYPQGL